MKNALIFLMIWVIEFPALQVHIFKGRVIQKRSQTQNFQKDFVNFLCSSLNISALYNFLVFAVLFQSRSFKVSLLKKGKFRICILFKVPKTELSQPK